MRIYIAIYFNNTSTSLSRSWREFQEKAYCFIV